MDPNGNIQDKIKQTLQETADLRDKRRQISTGTGVVILLMVAYLCFDLFFFAQSYDAVPIVEEIQNEIPRLLRCEATEKLMDDISNTVIPAYINVLKEKMTASEKKYEEECLNVLTMLEQEIGPAVQEKIIVELGRILVETESMIRSEYPDFTPEEVTQVLTTLQSEIEIQYRERVNKQLALLFGDISKSIEAMRNDPVYQELAAKDTPELGRMLLTSSLELMIHEIDPNALTR